MNWKILTSTRHRRLSELFESVQRLIETAHAKIISTLVVEEATALAEHGLPADGDFRPFLQSIRGAYAQLRAKVQAALSAASQEKAGSRSKEAYDDELSRGDADIDAQRQKNRSTELDLNRNRPTVSRTAVRWATGFIFAFCFAEVAWLAGVFVMLGELIILSIIIATAIALGQSLGVRTAVRIIKEIPDPARARRRYFMLCVAAVLVSLVIGALRAYALSALHLVGLPWFITSAPFFATINLVLLAAVAFITHYYMPSKQEQRELDEADRLETELAKGKLRLATLEASRRELIESFDAAQQTRELLFNGEDVLIDLVHACEDEAVGRFKSEWRARSLRQPVQPVAMLSATTNP